MTAFRSDLDNCQKELDRCSLIYKSVDEACPFVGAVYGAVDEFFKDRPIDPLPAPEAETSEAQIRAGKTLASRPRIKASGFAALLTRAATGMTASNPDLQKTVDLLQQRCDRFLAESGEDISVEDALEFQRTLTDDAVLARDLATFLFATTLSSFYRRLLSATAETLRLDLYDGGACPTCGQKPHYGLLRKDDNAKVLQCWLCATRWVHARIGCPFCGNKDQDDLGYFTIEGTDACRVDFCRACSRYYKVFDLRAFDTDGEIDLGIHNLATLLYDVAARQEGFSPGSELEWVEDPV